MSRRLESAETKLTTATTSCGRRYLAKTLGVKRALILIVLGVTTQSACSTESAVVPETFVDIATTTSTSVLPTTTTTTTAPEESTAIFDFTAAGSIDGWYTQNDTVMGGVSQGTATWDAAQLVFAGDLSLDNNGGFTSLVSPIDDAIGTSLANEPNLVIEATGDGKTYLMQLRLNDNTRYVQRFTTQADQSLAYSMPLEEFQAVDWRLSVIADAPPLDPNKVAQIAIYLVDKQTGPFQLAITSFTSIR